MTILIKRFQIERGHITVIGVYTPEEGRMKDASIL
jgi:hypothetical protein